MSDKKYLDKLEGLFSGLAEPEPEAEPEPTWPAPPPQSNGPARPTQSAQSTPPVRPTALARPLSPRQPPAMAGLPLPAPAVYGRPAVKWRLLIWSVLGTLAALLLLAYGQALWFNRSNQPAAGAGQPGFVLPLSPTPTPSPAATPGLAGGPAITLVEPTPTVTPWPGGQIVVLTPAPADAGWVVSQEEAAEAGPNHFGDSFLYAGQADGQIYHAAFLFRLDQIPRGSRIHAASLRLSGLRADRLDPAGQAEWQLHMLAPAGDYHWPAQTFRQLHQAQSWARLAPALRPAELSAGLVYDFTFSPAQLRLLERRLLEGSDRFGQLVSFRIDGLVTGPGDNLFAWDSGHGPASQGAGPQLLLSLGPPPRQTPPPFYVMVTSTPTPQNISTAAAISRQMTAQATRLGTATPVPPYWATPLVVTATPTAANQATARAQAFQATAVALTTGEPLNWATATPSPTVVIITSTPTPLEPSTAVAQAQRQALATPLPPNWVTPLVVTSTPAPQNQATASYLQAVWLTTGTPTPLPANAQTATATPVALAVQPLASPTATATPSPTPQAIPASLLGKILFLSDREGASAEERDRAGRLQVTPQVTPQPYAYDPATGQLERLTAPWPYYVAAARDAFSADLAYQAYTRQLLWTNVNGQATEELAIHYYDYIYGVEQIVTRLGAGIAYDPAWSPVSDEIVFVATESGNDELWLINRDGGNPRQLTRNQWEWDKHPSWSPDGQQIVFYSNRTGANQLWLMNRDGSEPRLLLPPNGYNDFDPVWVKYLQPVPPLERQPDWRFTKPPGQ